MGNTMVMTVLMVPIPDTSLNLGDLILRDKADWTSQTELIRSIRFFLIKKRENSSHSHTSKKRVTLVTRCRNFFGFSAKSLSQNAENCWKACGVDIVLSFPNTARVAKCHGYDRYIRVKKLEVWVKNLGGPKISKNKPLFRIFVQQV